VASRAARLAARALVAGAGALAARRLVPAVTAAAPTPLLARTNFQGRPVSLAGGPALALGAAAAASVGAAVAGSAPAAAAALVAGLGSGAVGAYDDAMGAHPDQKSTKGFRGHLAALGRGRVTSGLVKMVGVGATGLAASALLATGRHRRRPALVRGLDLFLGAGVIAGTANLVNLLDLRPGRAIKAGLLLGVPLAAGTGPAGGLAAGTVGAAAGLLPADLGEQIMLGDSGANAMGALLGTALAARTGPLGRAMLLGTLAALTAASEKVSFSQVIADTPGLRALDALGRRAAPSSPVSAPLSWLGPGDD